MKYTVARIAILKKTLIDVKNSLERELINSFATLWQIEEHK